MLFSNGWIAYIPRMTVAFDTLKLARRLEAAGFSTQQAQDTAEALGDTLTATVATQADVQTLQSDLRGVEAKLLAEIQRVEAKLLAEIRELELRLRAEMSQMRAELRTEIAALRVEMIKWVVGVGVAGVLAVGGMLLALVRMLPHP